ncbi:N-acetyltransferase [Arthrobacter sp. H20]|uniref:N-acetyltransferase n=1 Tax=Arthrobacter sp. H20 TaxID=1267981 RepID=UPI00047BB753|nr:N-acetyltransferase [Arthrobacter sp. H20]
MTNDGQTLPAGCQILLNPPTGPSADLLTDAFADEPGMRWLCGPKRSHRQAWFAATERLLAQRPGSRRYLLLRDGRPVATQWATTAIGPPPVTAQLGWLARVMIGCGPAVVSRTTAYRRKEEVFIPPRATILEFLGVLEAARGTGLGGVLLRWALIEALTGPNIAPVHLSTADPRNVEIYRHLSFKVDGSFSLSGLQVTAMSLTAAN